MRFPELLPLVLLVLVPLLLHLLDRRRARVVRWPAIRFLRTRSSMRLRRLRAQEILLLCLRSGAVLALVLALVQFFVTEEIPVRAARAGPRLVVLYFDTSLSMGWRREAGGASILEEARARGAALLADGGGDDVIVLLDSHAAKNGTSGPPALMRAESARQMLDALALSGEPFSVRDALERSADVLDAYREIAAEIHIFSDFQASALREDAVVRAEAAAARIARHSDRAMVTLVDCGDRDARNGFVQTFSSAGLAAVRGRPAGFLASVIEGGAEVAGAAAAEETRVTIALKSGTTTLVERTVTAREGRDGFTLAHDLAQAGTARLSLVKARDGLPQDDERHLVLDVLPHISVLILDERRTPGERTSGSYVELALYPSGPEMPPPDVPFRPVRAAAMAPDALEDTDVLIVCPETRLSADAAARIEAFARAGGGVLFLAGAGAEPQAWREGFAGFPGPLPAHLETRIAPAAPLRVETFDPLHPALALFALAENGDLTAIRVRGYSPVSRLAPGVRVVAAMEGGVPWLLEQALGDGRILLMTTAISPLDTDLPRLPLFVPFLHRTVAYLAAQDPRWRLTELGEPLIWRLAGRHALLDVGVIDSDGERREAESVAVDLGTEVRYRNARNPGFYRLFATDAVTQERLSATFAVNVATGESRLEAVPSTLLEPLAKLLDGEVAGAPRTTSRQTHEVTIRRERRGWFVLAALALLLAEALVARRLAAERGAP